MKRNKKVVSLLIALFVMYGYMMPVGAYEHMTTDFETAIFSSVTQWNFSCFTADLAVKATDIQNVEYSGIEIHLNIDDAVTENGILWNTPGTTTSDNKVVANNRYIKYIAPENGEFSITFAGDSLGSGNNKPRIYIVSGDDESCMSKNNSDTNGVQKTASGAGSETTLTANMIKGRTYYIWPYCYGGKTVKFSVPLISFTAKTVPEVNEIDVVYKCEGNEVFRKNIALEGCYEGDIYEYISANYIKGKDGKMYVVGEDFCDSVENKILNSSSVGINSALKKSAVLSSDTEIIYEATETDVIFYDEFENLTGTDSFTFDNGRYWASEGKMTTINSPTEFYTIAEDGYYQILMVGAGTNKGTEIFRNKSDAEAQLEYEGGNELMGIKYNNKYYGLYSTYNGYLAAGDVLTVKGFGSGGVSDSIDYMAIRKIGNTEIRGADGITILPGGSSTKMEFISDIDEIPQWSVCGVNGVSIDERGIVTVAEDAEEGIAEIAASLNGGMLTAKKDIRIERVEIDKVELSGTTAINIGDTKTYCIKVITDQFGNDITKYADYEFISSDESIVKIDKKTGSAQALSKGTVQLGVNIVIGNAVCEGKKEVVSDNYFIVATAQGDKTDIDVTDIVKSENISRYIITTADKDGNKLSQYAVESFEESLTEKITVTEDAIAIYAAYDENGRLKGIETLPIKKGEEIKGRNEKKLFVWDSLSGMKNIEVHKQIITDNIITADTTGAAMVEVVPVYTYLYSTPDTSEDMVLSDVFADGEYTFEITKAPKNQYGCVYDFYVNDAMIGNNVNEKGIGREFTKGDELIYTAKDVTVNSGTITLQKREFNNLSGSLRVKDEDKGVAEIVVTKTPTITKRSRKVYILGDSLVAKYYGEPKGYDTVGLVGTARTGWGQLIDNFFDDTVDVVNLANSGQWAKGLQETAFTGVVQSGKPGDYLILEAGWNDKSKSNATEMKQAITEMVEVCEEMGIVPVLVTPNSSSSTFSAGENTQLASTMREVALQMQSQYNDVIFVDLAKLSHQFLSETYGTDTDAMNSSINLGHAGSSSVTGEKGDGLHLSYLGAMKYAELVAQSIADCGVEFIDKEFTWSISDKSGNTISVQVK